MSSERLCGECPHDIGTHYEGGPFRDQCRAMVPNDLFSDGQGLCQCRKFREAVSDEPQYTRVHRQFTEHGKGEA